MGIDQVNKAVIQMDQSTQQNAALVEETTAASKAMQQQAVDLRDQIEFFKVEVEQNVSSSARRNSPSPPISKSNPGASSSVKSKNSVSGQSSTTPAATTKPEPMAVGTSNGHDRREKSDDFFEEF